MKKKTLICITSCNRLQLVKRFIWNYLTFVNKNNGFEFLLAIDGNNPDYVSFATEYEIPMLISDCREGVGITKNRVIMTFKDYEYYFFIDDDVELIDSNIFHKFIEVSMRFEIPHLTLSIAKEFDISEYRDEIKLKYYKHGGGYFNFFTKSGLDVAGGWHIVFARFKRYGHTEHTYRYFNLGLLRLPFVCIDGCEKMVLLHDPPHVTIPQKCIDEETGLFSLEKRLIERKLTFYPFKTISRYYFNGYEMKYKDANGFLDCFNKRKYPLTKGMARMKALGDHYFLRFLNEDCIAKRIYFLTLSLLNNPLNLPFKHYIKTRLRSCV